jgi:hemerythrin-like metal-binding protein/PAS domain S-box-containing protein/putative nucleotidyltransferase with HDIG domain
MSPSQRPQTTPDPTIEKIEVFPWNTSFDTGIGTIDEQHRQLAQLLKRFAEKAVQPSSEVELEALFTHLADYANYHFETEEAIWEEHFHNDTWFTEHEKTHHTFLHQINLLKEGGKTQSATENLEKVLKFLISWLTFHIIDNDKRMAFAVGAIRDGVSIEKAKLQAIGSMEVSAQVLIEAVLKMYESITSRTLGLLKEREERRRLEEELRFQQQHERSFSDAVMRAAPGLITLYDNKNRLIRWNQRYEEISGYSNTELKKKSLFDFFEQQDHAEILTAIETLNSGGMVQFEKELVGSDGNKAPYLITAVSQSVKNRCYTLLSGVDVTSMKAFEETIEKKANELEEALVGTISAVSGALELRDPYTAGHQQRVADVAVSIAEKMGKDEEFIKGIRLGASIHDIGKLAIPSDLLTKPSRLTEIEYLMIKTHAEAGAKIIENIPFPWPIVEMVSQHHERLDGSGYPYGLKGEEISLEARIISVADVFDAMSDNRPYRTSLGIDKALDELTSHRGKIYDPEVVDILVELLEHEGDNAFPTKF